MRIRIKLLILLMLISLMPLLVVRASVQRDLTRMGDDLAKRSENILVHKASNGLKRIVEDHARVLKRERQLLESTSLLLASRIEGVFYGHAHTPEEGSFALSESEVDAARKEYYSLRMGRHRPLEVDFMKLSSNAAAAENPVMEHLVPLLGKLKFMYPKLILWVGVSLLDGSRVTYPEASGRGMMGQMFGAQASSGLVEALTWFVPQQDEQTSRMAFRVTAPIRDASGGLVGNLFIVIPVDSILHENQHVSIFSDKAESLLVQAVAGQEGRTLGLRIIAQEQSKQTMRGHWQVPEEETWLYAEDEEQLGIMTAGLVAHKPGVVGMPYKNNDALWAYAPIDESGTSLLLIVPKVDIVKDAQIARQYVETQVGEHNSKMGFVVLFVAGLVLVIALLLSKLFTRNITELVGVVQSVAKGNFAARAIVRSTDEIGQLGATINKMVPELQERVAMKNSLEVAQEVQQSLLPSANPSFAGADIAAMSSYCDETGGDYYGFIPRMTDNGESIVVAVGDVSGHGVPAALMMASARAYLRSQASGGASLDTIVSAVNKLISEDVDGTGRFMTLFLLELTSEGTVQWVRAGHDPALLYDPATDHFEELVGGGLPLGVTADAQYDINQRKDLRAGQMIVIGTDGIWEMHSESGEMFGKERLKALVREYAHDGSEQLIAALRESLVAFQGRAEQLDDITVAAIKIG